MARYWNVYKNYFRSSFVRELEFRANFIAKLMGNAVWIGFGLMVVLVIYGNTNSVAGWDRTDSLLLLAVATIVASSVEVFSFGLLEIPEQVRKGTLDFVLTKPVDTQFAVSLRRVNFDRIGSVIAGWILFVLCIVRGAGTIHQDQVIACIVAMMASCCLYYSLILFFMTMAIWFVRVENLWVLGEVTMNVARYPIDIYSGIVKRIFFSFLPVAFLASVPVLQLVRGTDFSLVMASLGWALAALIGTRLLWRRALRSYSSASS